MLVQRDSSAVGGNIEKGAEI